jgi:hypothetical protein
MGHATHFAGLDRKRRRSSGRMAQKFNGGAGEGRGGWCVCSYSGEDGGETLLLATGIILITTVCGSPIWRTIGDRRGDFEVEVERILGNVFFLSRGGRKEKEYYAGR